MPIMSMKIASTHRSTLAALLGVCTLAFSLSGCDCGTEPFKVPAVTLPKVGAAYNYVNYSKDTLGARVDASQTFSTRTVIANNATVAGKTGVVQYVEGTDTASMHFETNGDVQVLQPAMTFPNDQFSAPPGLPFPTINIAARWVMFGYGSKAQNTVPPYDTSVTVQVPGLPIPVAVNIKMNGTTSYIGTEDIMVNAEKIATQKGLLTVNTSFVTLLGTIKVTTTDTLWFSQKLGIFVKDDGLSTAEMPAQFGRSGIVGGTLSTLTGYTIP